MPESNCKLKIHRTATKGTKAMLMRAVQCSADVNVCAPSQSIAPVQRERPNHPSLPAHPPPNPPRKKPARELNHLRASLAWLCVFRKLQAKQANRFGRVVKIGLVGALGGGGGRWWRWWWVVWGCLKYEKIGRKALEACEQKLHYIYYYVCLPNP